MKRYIKDDVIKYANEIIIRNEQSQIINPTEEMLINDGWVEYIYVPEVIEITDEEYLYIMQNKSKLNGVDISRFSIITETSEKDIAALTNGITDMVGAF